MSLTRREMLQGVVAGALAPAIQAGPPTQPQPYFGLHPFIEQNPKAVFIRRTHVAGKFDAADARFLCKRRLISDHNCIAIALAVDEVWRFLHNAA